MATQAPQPPQGMRDHLPGEYRKRLALADRIRGIYAKYGYAPIETPAMEKIEILRGNDPENEKLMFEVLKRGDSVIEALKSVLQELFKIQKQKAEVPPATLETFSQQIVALHSLDSEESKLIQLLKEHAGLFHSSLPDLALRFDLTIPLARFYATNRAKLPPVFRCQHIGPVWRADRPQKGRFREFMQCDVDAVGSASPAMEAEVILATAEVFRTLLGDSFAVHFNDRRLLTAALNTAGIPIDQHPGALIALDKLDKIGRDKVLEELQSRGISSQSATKLLDFLYEADDWPSKNNPLSGPSDAHSDLQTILDLAQQQANIVFDPFLVRGQGYYTGPIFEVRMPEFPGAMAGGGRYDGLIGRFLDKPVPAVGFSIGFERLLLVLEEKGIALEGPGEPQVFVPLADAAQQGKAFALAAVLRARGLRVLLQADPGRLPAQLKLADEVLHIPFAAILDADGLVVVKDLKARASSQPMTGEEAVAELLRRLPPA